MKYRQRTYYSETDKALMWDRWQKGESLQTIAQLFNRNHSSIAGVLSRTGGIRPPQRTRSRSALSLAEREDISRGVVAGHSVRSIAATLERSPSTVSREIARNGGRQCYRASEADLAAWDRAPRAKTCKLVQNRDLARIVASKLKKFWSPAQIAGWLKQTYPHDENMQVSHETLYRSLFIQARGALKKTLLQHLRRTRVIAVKEATVLFTVYRVIGRCVVRAITHRRPMITAGLVTQSRSASVRHRWKTGPCQGIGKVI